MSARRVHVGAAFAIALCVPFMLAGCAPGGASSLTVSYTLDGEKHTVTMRTDTVTCDDLGVSGNSIDHPVGQFGLQPATDSSPGSGDGGMEQGAGIVAFTSDDLDFSVKDGSVTIKSAPVDVKIFATTATGAAPDAEVQGTLTAALICAKAQ